MSLVLHIFAKSVEKIDPATVVKTAKLAWHGEGSVAVEYEGIEWKEMLITLPGVARPITLYRDIESAMVSELCSEQLEERPELPAQVRQHIASSRQVLSFEISPSAMNDDAWELLDIMESFFAQALDGLIVTDDGIYDANLKRLVQ